MSQRLGHHCFGIHQVCIILTALRACAKRRTLVGLPFALGGHTFDQLGDSVLHNDLSQAWFRSFPRSQRRRFDPPSAWYFQLGETTVTAAEPPLALAIVVQIDFAGAWIGFHYPFLCWRPRRCTSNMWLARANSSANIRTSMCSSASQPPSGRFSKCTPGARRRFMRVVNRGLSALLSASDGQRLVVDERWLGAHVSRPNAINRTTHTTTLKEDKSEGKYGWVAAISWWPKI